MKSQQINMVKLGLANLNKHMKLINIYKKQLSLITVVLVKIVQHTEGWVLACFQAIAILFSNKGVSKKRVFKIKSNSVLNVSKSLAVKIKVSVLINDTCNRKT